MHYNKEKNRIEISVGEIIGISLRRNMQYHMSERETSLSRPDASLVSRIADESGASPENTGFGFDFTAGETLFHTVLRPVCIKKHENGTACITCAFCVSDTSGIPSPQEKKRGRGEAFFCAYAYRMLNGTDIRIKTVFVNPENGNTQTYEEAPPPRALSAFFDKLTAAICTCGSLEIHRIKERVPSLQRLKFPYPSIREGQKDMIESGYRAIVRGRKLYACAPTGTGKTVCALYPAIRALGDGNISKIFYLTPKTTTAYAAMDTVKAFHAGGADLRSVLIIAKERICRMDTVCRRDPKACRMCRISRPKQESALSALRSMESPVITPEDIRKTAEEYGVCPYELSLDYSMECDIVICDYNYLFDLHVCFHRYFDEGGDYCFLVDEAHNLIDRARELYSAEITLGEIRRMAETVKNAEVSGYLSEMSVKFEKTADSYLADNLRYDSAGNTTGFDSLTEIPEEIRLIISAADAYFSELTSKREYISSTPRDELNAVRSFYYRLDGITSVFSLFSDKFRVFMEKTKNDISVKIVCLDPSEVIKKKLGCGKSAIFFSATMQPTEYYKKLLGGDSSDFTVEVPSPFDADNVCIAVMDKISTRFSARNESVFEIAEAIYVTVTAKEGNYMVFCPSFAYMNKIYSAFSELYPEIKSIRQKSNMSGREREEFLHRFDGGAAPILGFCVMGGVYSEGIDLVGDRLVGTIIVGVGIPQISNEREAIRDYFDTESDNGMEYAYIFPGMNRVLQATGRVIRSETDRGVIVMIDDRFGESIYRRIFPEHYRSLLYTGNSEALAAVLNRFWNGKR